MNKENISELIKINNEIAEKQNQRSKSKKRIKICESIVLPLSITHIVLAGLYGLAIIIPEMMNVTNPLLAITPLPIVLISSCGITIGTTSIIKTINEKKKDKLEEDIEILENKKSDYISKIASNQNKQEFKQNKKETQILDRSYEYLQEETQNNSYSLSLRK